MLVFVRIDYHLFQGLDHFYLYDHIYSRDATDISYFYDILKENYIDTGYVTLITWPMVARQGEHVWYQFSAFGDCIRRFAHESKFLFLTDIDEFIIPKPNKTGTIVSNTLLNEENNETMSNFLGNNHEIGTKTTQSSLMNEGQRRRLDVDFYFTSMLYPNIDDSEMITVRQIVNATLNEKDSKYNGMQLLNYPGLQSIYNIWNDATSVHLSNKELGCDATSTNNRFDTFFERGSCLHYKTKSFGQLKKESKINWKKNTKARQLYKLLSGNGQMYEVRAKVLINPRSCLFSIHHQTVEFFVINICHLCETVSCLAIFI